MRISGSTMPRHSPPQYGIPKAIGISYGAGAPWWWWEAQPFDMSETTTMIVIGIVLSFVVPRLSLLGAVRARGLRASVLGRR